MVTVNVSNFNLVNKIGQPNVAGEGHINFYLNTTPGPLSTPPASTPATGFIPVAGTSNTFTGVSTGTHNFYAELVNNDNTSLTPPVVAFVTATVNLSTTASRITMISVQVTPVASPAASPSPSPTATASPAASPSPTATASPSPSPTATASASPTVTASPSPSPTATATASPAVSPSPSPSPSPTVTASPGVTASPSPSPSPTASPAATGTTTPAASPSPSPSASPSPSPTVRRYNVVVTVQVANFDMTQSTILGNAPGRGRILYTMDMVGTTIPNNAVMTAETSNTFTPVISGRHVFRAELVNNDRTLLSLPVFAQVTITLP